MISGRGRQLFKDPPPLIVAHFHCARDPYHPVDNPDGYVNLGTAENHLLWDLLSPKLLECRSIGAEDTHYGELHGSRALRERIAAFLEPLAKRSVDPDALFVASGCSALLDLLLYVLCEPGDGVLVPAPYYSGFDHDLKSRAGVRPVPAPLSSTTGFSLCTDSLGRAYEKARREGINMKALLITSPNNPLGITYSRDLLRELVEFCRHRDLDLISDEIYAHSAFAGQEFTSLLSFAREYPGRIHFLYGLAKDFALSGFKVGILESGNEEVLDGMKELSNFCSVSTDTQFAVKTLLEDAEWTESLLNENKRRIRRSYEFVRDRLQQAGLRFPEANAGIFIFLDLRHLLSPATFDKELELYHEILDRARTYIAPGKFFHCEEPGWFRVCYGHDLAHLELPVKRLLDFFSKRS